MSETREPLLEFRVRREFRGKSGIEGTDYVVLPTTDKAVAARMAAEQLRFADSVHLESRSVSAWKPVLKGSE